MYCLSLYTIFLYLIFFSFLIITSYSNNIEQLNNDEEFHYNHLNNIHDPVVLGYFYDSEINQNLDLFIKTSSLYPTHKFFYILLDKNIDKTKKNENDEENEGSSFEYPENYSYNYCLIIVHPPIDSIDYTERFRYYYPYQTILSIESLSSFIEFYSMPLIGEISKKNDYFSILKNSNSFLHEFSPNYLINSSSFFFDKLPYYRIPLFTLIYNSNRINDDNIKNILNLLKIYAKKYQKEIIFSYFNEENIKENKIEFEEYNQIIEKYYLQNNNYYPTISTFVKNIINTFSSSLSSTTSTTFEQYNSYLSSNEFLCIIRHKEFIYKLNLNLGESPIYIINKKISSFIDDFINDIIIGDLNFNIKDNFDEISSVVFYEYFNQVNNEHLSDEEKELLKFEGKFIENTEDQNNELYNQNNLKNPENSLIIQGNIYEVNEEKKLENNHIYKYDSNEEYKNLITENILKSVEINYLISNKDKLNLKFLYNLKDFSQFSVSLSYAKSLSKVNNLDEFLPSLTFLSSSSSSTYYSTPFNLKILIIVASWCPHCQQFKSEALIIAEHFSDNDLIDVGIIEGDKIEVPMNFNLRGFPSIFFFTTNSPKLFEYEFDVNAPTIIHFIEQTFLK